MRLYHGTLSKHVPAIQRDGLKPPPGTGATWFMLTTSRDQAAWYARRNDGVVLEFEVPEERIYGTRAYRDSDVDAWLWPGQPHMDSTHPGAVAYAVKGVLPPETLVATRTYTRLTREETA